MKVNFSLPQKSIDQLAKELDKLLSNTIILYVKTLNCHWNLQDPRFISLHTLFEEQYKELAENGDLIAERIRQMGVEVDANMKHFLKVGSTKEIEKRLTGNEMIETLATSHEEAIKEIRDLIALTEKLNDPGTNDLLCGILRGHEKTAWFLRSHL
jgi:starvation-inducible DNA-binding protein